MPHAKTKAASLQRQPFSLILFYGLSPVCHQHCSLVHRQKTCQPHHGTWLAPCHPKTGALPAPFLWPAHRLGPLSLSVVLSARSFLLLFRVMNVVIDCFLIAYAALFICSSLERSIMRCAYSSVRWKVPSCFSDGRSNMASVSIISHMVRRPRPPSLYCIAFCTI